MLASGILEITDSEDSWNYEVDEQNEFKPAPLPLVCREILGQSVVERTIESLQHAGVKTIWIIAPGKFSSYVKGLSRKYRGLNIFLEPNQARTRYTWANTQNRGEQVLIVRLGAYVEFDVPDLLRFHKERQESLVRVRDSQGLLDVWVTSSAALSGTTPIQWFASQERAAHADYFVNGYVNRLRSWSDFRNLTKDILLMRCVGKPHGREIRPGVWLDDDARVHPRARVVAPAYFGRHTITRAEAQINRLSSVERYCEIGCGTVVEDATVLPYTRIGEGLHVSHAIVDESRIVCLRRGISVDLKDPKFLSSTGRRPPIMDPVKNQPKQSVPEVSGFKQAFSLGTALPRVLGFLKDEI